MSKVIPGQGRPSRPRGRGSLHLEEGRRTNRSELRLSDEEDAVLDALCRLDGKKRARLLRDLIVRYAAERGVHQPGTLMEAAAA